MDANMVAQQNGNLPTPHPLQQDEMAVTAPEQDPRLSEYMKRYEFMFNSLNGMKAEGEARRGQIDQAERELDNLNERIKRQEGATLMMRQIIIETDPEAFSRQEQQAQQLQQQQAGW